jgi:hypothetical protein
VRVHFLQQACGNPQVQARLTSQWSRRGENSGTSPQRFPAARLIGGVSAQDMNRVNNLDEFKRLLRVIVLCAPDKFPVRDFLQPCDQLTLESAYSDLRGGMKFVAGQIRDTTKIGELQCMLDQSLSLYQAGERVKAAHLLQDFEDAVLENQHGERSVAL